MLANMWSDHNLHLSTCDEGSHEQVHAPPKCPPRTGQLSAPLHTRNSNSPTTRNRRPTVRDFPPNHRTRHRLLTLHVLLHHPIHPRYPSLHRYSIAAVGVAAVAAVSSSPPSLSSPSKPGGGLLSPLSSVTFSPFVYIHVYLCIPRYDAEYMYSSIFIHEYRRRGKT